MRVTNTSSFILKAIEIHGNEFDYSKSIYVKSKEELIITCRIHGDFMQRPNNHLQGKGCSKCSYDIPSTEEFIEKVTKIHDGYYTYPRCVYQSARGLIIITCDEHGDFKQAAKDHTEGSGCILCANESKYYTNETFIQKALTVHNNTYTYDNVEYVRSDVKVLITCDEHGDFEQIPSAHLSGQGCPYCRESKGNRLIRQLLTENKIKFDQEKRFDDCRNKKPLPFDFYLPEYNVCIEYDGEQHSTVVEAWGGEEGLKYRQYNDYIKTQYCESTGIKLLRIPHNGNHSELLGIFLKRLLDGSNS